MKRNILARPLAVALSATTFLSMVPATAITTYAASAAKVKSVAKSGTTASAYTVKVGKTKTLKAKITFKKKVNKATAKKSIKITTSKKANVSISSKTFSASKTKSKTWTVSVKVKAVKKGSSKIAIKASKGAKAAKTGITWAITAKAVTPTPEPEPEPEPTPEVVEVTGVTLSTTTPKVGDTITANVEPSNATNVATYAWFYGDTADNAVNAIAGETSSSLTLTSDLLSKFIKVVVTDVDGKEFTATTTAAVAAKVGTLEAKQTGANTIIATAGAELSATDKVVLKKGSTEQTITYALGEDKKTITITTSSKIATDDYTVEVTPTDTGLAKLTASFKGEAEKLTGLNFGKELALVNATDFYTAQTTITGANQFGEDFNLGSGTVQVYPSVAIDDGTNNATVTTNYNSTTKVYTLVKGGSIPFQIGDKVNFTAIYTSGATVIQQTAELTVANVPYVASMEFGDVSTTNAKLKDKRITVSNFRKGTYYVPVVAKDQYGNVLDADALNAKVAAQSLFINPSDTQGAYGGFDDVANGGDGFTKLDDGTTVMNVGAKADSLPGDCVITIAGLGGLSTSTKITVEDDPYIASMNVVFPGSLYQSTTAEFTVEATDQYGDAVSLYDQKDLAKVSARAIYLGDYNNLTKNGSTITVSSGSLSFERNSAKKTVVFKYTPGSTSVNDVVTITSAVPKVETKTLTIGKIGTPSGIQKTLDTTKDYSALTITAGGEVDFANALVFTDTNGEKVTGTPVAKPTVSNDLISTTVANDGVNNDGNGHTYLDAAADTYYYNVVEKSTGDPVAGADAAGIMASETYVANLYYVEEDDGIAKLLDSKEFKVTVTNPNTDGGNLYESYEATIKKGDELLFNAKLWDADNDGDQDDAYDASVLDKATIIVKGTDANGNTATLTFDDEYTLTVDQGLDVNASGDIVPAATAKVATNTATLVEGEATVTVWDKISGNEVASVKVPYSNAAPKATKWTVTQGKGNEDDAANIEFAATGTTKTEFTGDTVDTANPAAYALDVDEGAALIWNGVDNGTAWLLENKNQYGTRYQGVTWNVAGTKITGDKTNEVLTNLTDAGKKYTFQATAAGVDTFNFFAVVEADADIVAEYEALEDLTFTANSSGAKPTVTVDGSVGTVTATSATTSHGTVAVDGRVATVTYASDGTSVITVTVTGTTYKRVTTWTYTGSTDDASSTISATATDDDIILR
jgi:hypothetical protein